MILGRFLWFWINFHCCNRQILKKQSVNMVTLYTNSHILPWVGASQVITVIFLASYTTSRWQCDQIGRIIGLCPTFQSLWQQLVCPNLPHSYAIFVDVWKSPIFLVEIFLGNIWWLFTGHTGRWLHLKYNFQLKKVARKRDRSKNLFFGETKKKFGRSSIIERMNRVTRCWNKK